jgi:hypothetical protein
VIFFHCFLYCLTVQKPVSFYIRSEAHGLIVDDNFQKNLQGNVRIHTSPSIDGTYRNIFFQGEDPAVPAGTRFTADAVRDGFLASQATSKGSSCPLLRQEAASRVSVSQALQDIVCAGVFNYASFSDDGGNVSCFCHVKGRVVHIDAGGGGLRAGKCSHLFGLSLFDGYFRSAFYAQVECA